jgi:hypothetical protein
MSSACLPSRSEGRRAGNAKTRARSISKAYRAARLASGLTTAEDYAQAARELAELLERGYATAEKRCADALWEDCLLAVSRTAHLERTVETTDSSDAVLRAARRVLPAARRAELERARRDAAVARKRREKRGNRSISPDFLRSFDDDDDDDDDDGRRRRRGRGASLDARRGPEAGDVR